MCPPLYGTHDLRNVIQASDDQLSNALGDLHAILIENADGTECWRVLDMDYMHNILTSLIFTAQADRFQLEAIPETVAGKVSQDDNVPLQVVLHVLRIFSEPVQTGMYKHLYCINNSGVWQMLADKVGPFYGKTLLSRVGRVDLYKFQLDWRQEMPPDFDVDMKMLRGYYLLEKDPRTDLDSVRWWSRDVLSADAKTRFQQIFQEREKWRAEDLAPYLEDLAPTQKQMDALLLKFARISTLHGVKYFTKRFN